MRLSMILTAAIALAIAAPAFAGGPFSDVPNGHWAYKAIEKAVEAGILQGYDGKFHGNKTLNRYQMAVVVARMLDRIETMGPGGKVGKKDIENLEALTIEFADELALLNVKVSTLEDSFAELKKDVDGLKKDYALGGAKAGISGLFQTRYVMTDDDANNFAGRTTSAGGASPAGTFANNTTAGVPVTAGSAGSIGTGVAGTIPLSRYVAGAPFNPTGANLIGASRGFFNIAQSSVGFDRHFDEDFYLHLQLDFNANQEGAFVNASAVQVNEAYVDMEKWLFEGDVRLRAGAWALPFQRERNPEMVEYPNQLRYGYRSLDLTISPTFSDANWERIRNVGAAIWNGKDSGFQWQLGAGNNRPGAGLGFTSADGSLLAWRTATIAAGRDTRFGDSLQSIDNNGAGADNMSFYGWVGDKYEGGFRWDAGYYQNGGNVAPVAGDIATSSEWSGFQANVGWWGWEDWGFMGSYYTGDSTSNTTAARGPLGAAVNFAVAGLAPASLAAATAGIVYPDVESRSWSVLANYKFNDDNNITVRYEDLEDTMGAAAITARAWTFDWNHRISANSLLQLEWVSPESDSVTSVVGTGAANGVAAGSVGGLTRNSTDVDDNLIQLNYKVKF